MSDLQKYIKARKLKDAEFSIDFDEGYQEFKIDVLLKSIEISSWTKPRNAGRTVRF